MKTNIQAKEKLKKLTTTYYNLKKMKPKEKKQDWREDLYRLDIGDPNSKGCTITLGEYLGIDCPELENFISTLLEQTREEAIDSCIEALPKENNDMPDVAWRAGFNQAIDQSLYSLQLLKNKK